MLSILLRFLGTKLNKYEEINEALAAIIKKERDAIMTAEKSSFEVEEKSVESALIAGIRTKGMYSDSGKLFGKLCRAAGRHVAGKPFNLYYDGEYKEHDADLESCVPLKKVLDAKGISVRELGGGKCVSLIHRGPYEEIGRSYERIMRYVKEKGYKTILPTREIYVKGPGMIFKGNPKKYLTEIQILLEA